MRLLGPVLALLLVACEQPERYGATARFELTAGTLPDPLEVPWPSDVYRTDADGTIADGIVRWQRAGMTGASRQALEAYGALDGFGRNSAALFLVEGDAEVDASSLPAAGAPCTAPDSAVAIIDLDPSSATPGARLPCYAGVSPGTKVIVVGPEQLVLEPGHRYAAVLTTRATAGGAKIGPSATFAAIRDDQGSARSTAEGKLYGEAVEQVVRLAKLERKHIAALAVFTTQTSHRKLKEIRDALVEGKYGAAPALVTSGLAAPLRVTRFGAVAHPGWTATLGEWLGTPRLGANGKPLPGFGGAAEQDVGVAHDAVGAILTAAFPSPNFLRPWSRTTARSDGTMQLEADGLPKVQSTDLVPVVIILPRAPAPAGGYPVVIYQHGAGQQKVWAGAVGNELARAGIAVVAIDGVFQGLRAAGAVDEKSNGSGTYSGPDGFADADASMTHAMDVTGSLGNFLKARDSLWQVALDIVQARRLLGVAPDLSLLADQYGGVAPKLDPNRVGYLGMSMGGIVGATVAAIEPRASMDPFVLNAAAAAVVTIAFADGPQSGTIGIASAALSSLPIYSYEGRLRLYPNLGQGIFDGADPASFGADLAASDHNLWMLSADQDEATCNSATDLMARAMALTQVTPTLRPISGLEALPSPVQATQTGGRLHAFYGVSPGHHAHLLLRFWQQTLEPPWPREGEPRIQKLPAPSLIRQSTLGAQRAVAHFFTTTWEGAAEIAVTGPEYPGLIPVPDFDDDGFCDETERSGGANPYDRTSRPDGAPDCAREVGFAFP